MDARLIRLKLIIVAKDRFRSWEQHVDAIQAYVTRTGCPASEYEGLTRKAKHFAHVEPFQKPELKQTTFHVILDVDQNMPIEPSLNILLSQIYRLRRDTEGNLCDSVAPFRLK